MTVPAFKAAAGPVTVAQFRQFVVEQHGYDRAELWSAEDFKHFKQAGQRWPATWTVQASQCIAHAHRYSIALALEVLLGCTCMSRHDLLFLV